MEVRAMYAAEGHDGSILLVDDQGRLWQGVRHGTLRTTSWEWVRVPLPEEPAPSQEQASVPEAR